MDVDSSEWDSGCGDDGCVRATSSSSSPVVVLPHKTHVSSRRGSGRVGVFRCQGVGEDGGRNVEVARGGS